MSDITSRRAIPELLQRVIDFAQPSSSTSRIELTQIGTMWRTPTAKPLNFTARQWIDPTTIAFAWVARFPMLPGFTLHVTDAFEDGAGVLSGKLWGWLRIFKKTGVEIDRGEVYRYLAELPLAPASYLANQALVWEQVDDATLRVSYQHADRPVTVTFFVDPSGRIISGRAEDRPCDMGDHFIERPWVGTFGDWKRLGDQMIPTAAEVAWETPDGRFTYWRGMLKTHAVLAP